MRAAIYARMSTNKQNDRSPDDQAAVPLPPRLEAFAEALGRAVAETILRDLRAGTLRTPRRAGTRAGR
jgi:DNA invertase Pin-like site-specific DNA recombinase